MRNNSFLMSLIYYETFLLIYFLVYQSLINNPQKVIHGSEETDLVRDVLMREVGHLPRMWSWFGYTGLCSLRPSFLALF